MDAEDTTRSTSRRGKVFSRCLRFLFFAYALSALALWADPYDAVGVDYRVKAGYIFNFTKFVEWPAEVLEEDGPLRIGILGPENVYQYLDSTFSGKMSGQRRIVVELCTLESLENPPHVLFVHREAGVSVKGLEAIINSKPVLIVGESPSFAMNGGMIGFVERGDTLRFQINPSVSQEAGLALSSRLASLGEVVQSRP